jgi:hypothetical protein
MLQYAVPPGYQRQQPIRRPKLGPWLGVIDAILEDDKQRSVKQRHTAMGKRKCARSGLPLYRPVFNNTVDQKSVRRAEWASQFCTASLKIGPISASTRTFT